MKKFLILFCLNISLVAAGELKSLTVDGCSMFPDGTEENPTVWLECCHVHDASYWMGGTLKERRETDLRFKQCMEEKGDKAVSIISYIGVVVGGGPLYPTPYRWGYGWKGRVGYRTLSEFEKQSVKEKLSEQDVLSVDLVEEVLEVRNLF
jgi:hypothetical protein